MTKDQTPNQLYSSIFSVNAKQINNLLGVLNLLEKSIASHLRDLSHNFIKFNSF